MPDFPDEAEVQGRTAGPSKVRLRASLLARRRALPAHTRTAAARLVRAELATMIRRVRPRLVAGHVPVGSEPGGPELPEALRDALGDGGELLLPVLRPDLDLDWATYRGPDQLHPAGRGLREPTGERLGPEVISQAELVIVPALAVDRTGVRLGRGGGSYDRALARVPSGTMIVALLHDGELVTALPAQPHDRPVLATVTPGLGLRPVAVG